MSSEIVWNCFRHYPDSASCLAGNSRPTGQPHRKPVGHRSWDGDAVRLGAVGFATPATVVVVGTLPRGTGRLTVQSVEHHDAEFVRDSLRNVELLVPRVSTISRVIWRWILSWPWNVGQRSLKVIKISAIRKLGCGFLFAFHGNYGRIFSHFGDIQRQRMVWPCNLGLWVWGRHWK